MHEIHGSDFFLLNLMCELCTKNMSFRLICWLLNVKWAYIILFDIMVFNYIVHIYHYESALTIHSLKKFQYIWNVIPFSLHRFKKLKHNFWQPGISFYNVNKYFFSNAVKIDWFLFKGEILTSLACDRSKDWDFIFWIGKEGDAVLDLLVDKCYYLIKE